jgi:hypothetical protein
MYANPLSWLCRGTLRQRQKLPASVRRSARLRRRLPARCVHFPQIAWSAYLRLVVGLKGAFLVLGVSRGNLFQAEIAVAMSQEARTALVLGCSLQQVTEIGLNLNLVGGLPGVLMGTLYIPTNGVVHMYIGGAMTPHLVH